MLSTESDGRFQQVYLIAIPCSSCSINLPQLACSFDNMEAEGSEQEARKDLSAIRSGIPKGVSDRLSQAASATKRGREKTIGG